MLASLPSTIGVLRLAELKCEVGKTWGPARGMHRRRRFMILEALGRVDANWYPMEPWFHPPPLCHLVCSASNVMRRKASLDSLSFGPSLGADTCCRQGCAIFKIIQEKMLQISLVQGPNFKRGCCNVCPKSKPKVKYKACTGKQKPLSHHLSQALRSVWTCPWLWAAEVDESLSVTSSIDTDSPTNLTSCPCPYAVVLIEERRAKHLNHWKDRAHPRSETKVSLLLALVKLQNPINQDLLRQWMNQNNRNPPERRQSLQPG